MQTTFSLEKLRELFFEQVSLCKADILNTSTEPELRARYAQYAGNSGSIRIMLSTALKSAPNENKKEIGRLGNVALTEVEGFLAEKLSKNPKKLLIFGGFL